MRKPIRFVALVLINYAVLVTTLFTLECVGHLSYRLVKGKYIFQRHHPAHVMFQSHPYLAVAPQKSVHLVENPGQLTITTDANGFRSTDYPSVAGSGVKTIVCLGGSTTFCTGVSDHQTWPWLLQEQLGSQFRVYNCGVPGYSTLEAMIQLCTQVPELNPDIIICYQGWNDIRSYHSDQPVHDYAWHGASQMHNLPMADEAIALSDYSFTYFLVRKCKQRFTRKEPPILYHVPDERVDQVYIRNLSTIKRLSHHLGARLIIVPQVVNEARLSTSIEQGSRWTPTIANSALPGLLKRLDNLVSQSLMSDSSTVVVDSLMTRYDWVERHFVDEGHFSEAGSRAFVDILLSDRYWKDVR